MSSQTPVIHLVDDDDDLRHALAQGLELEGHEVIAHARAEGVAESLARDDYAVVVSDVRMPGDDGMALLKTIQAIDSAYPVVLITGHGDVQLAVEAMQVGAYDFIEKPFAVSRLAAVIERALEKRRLVLENRSLRSELDQRHDLTQRLVGRSTSMVRLRGEIEAVADTDADVLVVGETGSGKEVVARALHDYGNRAKGQFVAINCAALPADIFESELFGHEPGAFTGAQKQRIGKLEYAQGGTIFLDEIESMPLDLQAKLLRAIEQRSIERLGSNRIIPLDVRFVAATKFDLEKEGAKGAFRSDLYYRLNVVTLGIPPLRDRKDDIPLLFFHLARDARARYRREIPEIDSVLENHLLAHDWPGNVRELRNYADRFVLGMWRAPDEVHRDATGSSLAERMAAFEKAAIESEITRQGGVLKPVYEALGISRKGLYDKMKRHGISTGDTID